MISEFIEYVKQTWKNKPNSSSPLNADRMNHMEDGIENNSKKIKETVNVVNELTDKKADFLSTYFHDGWITVNFKIDQNVLIIGHIISSGNADGYFCYLACAASSESGTPQKYKIAGAVDIGMNWNNGTSLGINASSTQWVEISVLYL